MSNEYTVKPKDSDIYDVFKFEEGCDVPIGFYTVVARGNGLTCNCMSGSYRGYCKHSSMVKEYRKKERAGSSIEQLAMFYVGNK